MTPYERMLQEKYKPARTLCQPEPLATIQPEAVNYRPLW